MAALIAGHRAIDATRDVQAMNLARVAAHASQSEAEAWAKRQARGGSADPGPQDLRAAWRASLEALGITVEE